MSRKHISPVHPGAYLKELLDELTLSQYRLASRGGFSHIKEDMKKKEASAVRKLKL
jgi:hypothetical protein